MESTCIIWCGKKIDVIYMVGPSIDHKPKNLSKCKNKLTRLAIHQCFRLHAIGLNESRDWIFLCKNWGISERYSPVFKTARLAKTISRIINTTASIWRECSDKFVLRLFLFLKAHGLLLGTDIWASCFPDKWRLLFIYYINNRHIPDFSIQFVAFWAVTSCRTFISRYQLPTTFTQPSQTGLLYSGYSAADAWNGLYKFPLCLALDEFHEVAICKWPISFFARSGGCNADRRLWIRLNVVKVRNCASLHENWRTRLKGTIHVSWAGEFSHQPTKLDNCT